MLSWFRQTEFKVSNIRAYNRQRKAHDAKGIDFGVMHTRIMYLRDGRNGNTKGKQMEREDMVSETELRKLRENPVGPF